MTDKEKLDAIRAEIHRLVKVRGYDKEMANDLFTFMDSLPEEPVSEDLQQAAKEYADEQSVQVGIQSAFKAGANWQKQQMMKEATVAEYWDNWLILDPYLRGSFGEGDKVKLIIIKEDKP